MAQRMDGGVGEVELLAGHDQQALEGRTRHGAGGAVHALGQGVRATVIPTADVGEEQEGVAVEAPVAAQFLAQGGGQGHDAILVSFALANEQFVFLAFDIVDGQPQALAQPQAATVDELERGAVAAEANMGQQIVHLLPGQDGGKGIVIFGADLRKDGPGRLAEQLDKEHFGGGQSLADGLGLPMLLEFDEQEVVAQLGLGNARGITGAMLVQESKLTIVSMAGPIGVVMERQEVSEPGHGGVGMLIVDGIIVISRRGPDAWRYGGPGAPLGLFAVRLRVEGAGE